MIAEIKHLIQDYGNIVALLFGILGQLISEEQITKRFALNVIWSSILVGVYLMPVILDYMGIEATSDIAKGLYALSPMISLQVTALIAAILPKVLQDKFLNVFGVTSKELKEYHNANSTSVSKED